jgi:outer membrane protein assembly factor BamB
VAAAVLLMIIGVVLLVRGDGDDNGDEVSSSETTTTTAADETTTTMAATAGEEVAASSFITRPDLTPPVLDVAATEPSKAGLVFLAPKSGGAQRSALIVDGDGQVVWCRPSEQTIADFRTQNYQGAPVLTWWEGTSADGHGQGELVVADAAYQEIARFGAGNGRSADLHELQLTDRGTALILAYQEAPADLTGVGGPADGYLLDNYVQEIDVATGEVLFEWNVRDHVALTDTYAEIVETPDPDDVTQDDGSEQYPFDFAHLNSVDVYDEDTLLVSARNTQAVYAVDRTTGELRWTLGGRSNQFQMGDGAGFHYQHDARHLPDGTISLFDNEGTPATADQSRGLILAVDPAARTATMVRQLRAPEPVLAGSQGNTQVLADGDVVVGWGATGAVTHFGVDDAVVLDATWVPADSYRVFRMPWIGLPTTLPDVVARSAADGSTTQVDVYVSWNGATQVAEWQVLGGSDPANLAPLATVAKEGFETQIAVEPMMYFAVQALDADGRVLTTSNTVGLTE